MDRNTVIDPIDFKFEFFESKYMTIPFTYNDKEVLLKAEGLFRSFMNFKDDETSYSITITVNEFNGEFFSKLEARIKKLVAEKR